MLAGLDGVGLTASAGALTEEAVLEDEELEADLGFLVNVAVTLAAVKPSAASNGSSASKGSLKGMGNAGSNQLRRVGRGERGEAGERGERLPFSTPVGRS